MYKNVYPDYSSDDDDFSDDNDYVAHKERIKKLHKAPELSEKEVQIRRISSAITNGILNELIAELDKGFDVNSEVEPGWEPLPLAISYCKPELVKEIVERGADVHITKDGDTLLMLACSLSPTPESLQIIELLLDKQLDVKATNRRRINALMFAASSGHLDAVQRLLPLSDKNAQDNQHWTALFWAVSGNHIKLVEYLLEQEFDCTIIDIRGQSVAELAKQNDFIEIADMFCDERSNEVWEIIQKCEKNNNLAQFKPSVSPKLFLDSFRILEALKSDDIIKQVWEKNVDLMEFLSASDKELKTIGVSLPFQRNRILNGLYRFHKQPFSPTSMHVVQTDADYTNMDVALQLVSALKQIVVMNASLKFIRHNIKAPITDLLAIEESLLNVEKKMVMLKIIARQLGVKVKKWDSAIPPADLITAKSHRFSLPWRKIALFSSISLVILLKCV